FTLDAMPGKQMAIDAELNAGIIDEATATRRRFKIQKEADFYGAMDGASKFVRGDAIAGILITLINIIGGFAIGILQKGLPIVEALQKFTLLSIGDGLVSQIPALIVSVAAGILVTRASGDTNLGVHISRELTLYPRAIAVAAGMLFVFGFMPWMPVLPFVDLGVLAAFIARQLKRSRKGQTEKQAEISSPQTTKTNEKSGSAAGAKPITPDFEKLIDVDVFAIELGYGLLNLANKEHGGDLLD